jgi:poly [ADP-ribose] polymerase
MLEGAMKVIEEARYILVDVACNSNKFWNIAIRDDHSAVTEWGRVGEAGSSKEFEFDDPAKARRFFDSKRREKETKGYAPLRTLGSTDANRSARLAEVALDQLNADCAETQRLVARLARANVHQILAQTSLRYDIDTGSFSTPLGIVTRDALIEARALLNEIALFVQADRYDDPGLPGILSQYFMLVPRDIGRAKPDPRKLFADLVAIREQNSLLDNLQASLESSLKPVDQSATDTMTRTFDAKLRHVENPQIINDIRKRFQRTAQRMHASCSMDVVRVFEVEIGAMRHAYEQRARKVRNVQTLWHGTRIGNLLSILKSGFVIPPRSAPHVTGRMFGNGVYFSDQSTKALNYASGFWSGSRETGCFMFLCDVALGRIYTPRTWEESFPHPGSDSTFARAGVSGVMNNEMVVYDSAQINPRYLVEFGR